MLDDRQQSKRDGTYFMELQFITPFTKTPLGNQINSVINRQETSNKFCADIEMLLINCLEQYGLKPGMTKCRGYLLDLKECHNMAYQGLRYRAMKSERQRQFRAGEREKEYEPAPPLDSY